MFAIPFNPRQDHSERFKFLERPLSPTDASPSSSHAPVDADGFREVMRKPSRAVKETPRPKPGHLFYDWDNGSLPCGYDIENLIQNITQGLRQYDNTLAIESLISCGEFFSLAINEPEEIKESIATDRFRYLSSFGVASRTTKAFKVPFRPRTCVLCPQNFTDRASYEEHMAQRHKGSPYQDHSRVMDVGDAILAREMKFIEYSATEIGVILIISSDRDYLTSAKFFSDRGWIVLLAETDGVESPVRYYARAVWHWDQLIRGRKPFLEFGPPELRRQEEQREQEKREHEQRERQRLSKHK